jgi:hypothetical protein
MAFPSQKDKNQQLIEEFKIDVLYVVNIMYGQAWKQE